MTLPRIYFDTNEGDHRNGYWLNLPRSRQDLDALSERLCTGLQVVIYMPDELEMFATLRHDIVEGFWIADPVPGTVRYPDRSED